MMAMLKFAVVGLLMALVVMACADGQSRSIRTPGPDGEDAFKTYCKRIERCLHDAKDVCPDGYEKLHVEDGAREMALTYKCHGHTSY